MLDGDPRKLWVRYAVAIGLIASLVTFSHIVSLQATRTGDEMSAAIDVSGRQRMLSQRILFFASEVYSGKSLLNGSAKTDLVAAIDLFEQSHIALTKGGDLGLSGELSPELDDLYFSDCSSCQLDQRVHDYVDAARVIAGVSDGDQNEAWLSLIAAGRQELLASLNQAVQLFEAESVRSIQSLRTISNFGYIFAIAVLILEALIIFMPAHRTIVSALDDLEEKNADLKASEEIAVMRFHEAERARIRAEKAEKIKADFIATMSHEVRTPMNGVLGMLDLLLRADLQKEQKERVTLARDSARNLMTLLEDMLDFTRLDLGRIQIKKVPFSVAQVVDSVVAITTAEAQRKKLDLSYTIQAGVPGWIVGDALRVRQMLTHLVGNSLKFTQIGSVRILLEYDGPEDEGTLFISVVDTGDGIASDVIDSIFERFEQGEAGYTRAQDGAGVGLALCRELVELMKGSISIDSQPGAGCIVKLAIPAKAVSEEDARVFEKSQEVEALALDRSMRVLIVEDHPINQKIIESFMKDLGFQSVVAHNGVEAVAKHQPGLFDLILMDIHMPQMDGLTASQQIRETDPDVPIVAVTADIGIGDLGTHLHAGMNDFVPKPIDPINLQQVLKKVLSQSSGS